MGLNELIICLIPKGETPKLLNQFRSISLCNVLVKVVSQILANRMKPIMEKLTGEHQSSFIPGRSTIDNIIEAQELVHTLMKKKGKNGVLLSKLILRKPMTGLTGAL